MSVLKRGKNSWRIQVYTVKDGKLCRITETVKGTKRAALDRETELKSNLNKGTHVPTSHITVAEHLKQWLEGYAKTNCAENTYDSYERIIRRHLVPAVGHLQLKDLTAPTIQRFYGQECGKMSGRSVLRQHRMLSQSLKYAVRQGYLASNPCGNVDPPKAIKKKMRTLTPDEVGILLETAKGNIFYPVIYTALNTGLREAELLGLRWRDINLEPHVLSLSVSQVLYKGHGKTVFKQPKTEHSRRRINMTTNLALYLASYKAERESLYWQQFGKPLTLDDLVFTTALGEAIHPAVLSHAFAKTVRRAGLGRCRFHDLRHTFASIMLLLGVSPKVISEALGHSSVAFTMDVYSHCLPTMQKDAMALLDRVMPGGVSGSHNTNFTPTLHNAMLGGA